MVKNRLLLGSVAFSVSFFLGLLVNRDFSKAFLTGLITLPATFGGVVVVKRKEIIQQKRSVTALEFQIHQLEKWEIELNQSLSELISEEERAERSINYLQEELTNLSIKTTQERSYKQQLSLDLVALRKQIGQMEAEAQRWETQVYKLEQSRGELDVSLRSLKAEKHEAEAGLKSLQAELQQLQAQVTEQQSRKQQLEAKSHKLQTHIQELEKQKTHLTQSLSAIAAERQTTEANQKFLQAQLSQLPAQVVESQDKLEQELIALKLQKRQRSSNKKQSEKLNAEWTEFSSQLPNSEFQVLKAIAEQENTNAVIKKIAEENITMPELLIAAINERALATIGDLIIEPGSVPPVIAEAEYLTNVKKMLKINEMN